MIQHDDFYEILPSNANTNLFPTNSESFYRVALPRQIHLKDEDDWEVELYHVIYPFFWFEVPHECDHPHLLFRRFGTQKAYSVTLPVGRYQTALDIAEGMLKCKNPQYFNALVIGFPEGGGDPGLMWGNMGTLWGLCNKFPPLWWGKCGDFASVQLRGDWERFKTACREFRTNQGHRMTVFSRML